jgi:hypothetical protein
MRLDIDRYCRLARRLEAAVKAYLERRHRKLNPPNQEDVEWVMDVIIRWERRMERAHVGV